MISPQDLHDIAVSRYQEAKILLDNDKPDGAIYLCGYALELMLKKCIVKTLNWDGYLDGREFENYKSFKVHNLDVLLHLSGIEKKIQADSTMYARWQIAKNWDSEIRYKQVGKVSKSEAQRIIDASKEVLNYLNKI